LLVAGLQPQVLKFGERQGAGLVAVEFAEPAGAVGVNFLLGNLAILVGVVALGHLLKAHAAVATEAMLPALLGEGRAADYGKAGNGNKNNLRGFLHGFLLNFPFAWKKDGLGLPFRRSMD
jgi:hypothetical protein